MLRKLIFLLFPVLISVGCNLKEDLSDCGVLRLAFRYTYNSQNVNRLTSAVRDIHVYAFDRSNDLLVDVIHVGWEDIAKGYVEVDHLPNGVYTFIAWAGSSEDMMDNGFIEAHMLNAASHDHTGSALIGETTLDNFYMMLDYDRLPTEVLGDIAPGTEEFDDLFHAAVEGIEVKKGNDRTVDFDFIRNTNVLKVTVTGMQYLMAAEPTRAASPDQPLLVYAVGENGRYKWDNSIDQHARQVRYEPPYTSIDESSMQVDIKTMRLDIERHEGDPVNIHISDPTTGRDMIDPLDVVKTILGAKDDEGFRVFRTQEDIDREYEFPININILVDLSVKISVGEWEVEGLNPNLRP